MQLGKIKKVDLRDVWKNEAYDFTVWLAKDENIKLLNDTLGLSITEVQTEQFVGNFRCDIVGKDEFTNNTVIIENQLEQTNHDHLGKIITYASGLDASIIIWVVKSSDEPHASAINWLNEHTDERISFFLLEVQLFKIGDSLPAPNFKIICAPNDYAKNMKKLVKDKEMSLTEAKRLDFWTRFNVVLEERKEFNTRKPSTDHWYEFSIGKSGCHLSCDLLYQQGQIRVNFYIMDNKDIYDLLFSHKEEIESVIGESLEWDRLDGKKASLASIYIPGLNINDDSNYTQLFNLIIDKLVLFKKAFKKFL